jgi:hypothetical protein
MDDIKVYDLSIDPSIVPINQLYNDFMGYDEDGPIWPKKDIYGSILLEKEKNSIKLIGTWKDHLSFQKILFNEYGVGDPFNFGEELPEGFGKFRFQFPISKSNWRRLSRQLSKYAYVFPIDIGDVVIYCAENDYNEIYKFLLNKIGIKNENISVTQPYWFGKKPKIEKAEKSSEEGISIDTVDSEPIMRHLVICKLNGNIVEEENSYLKDKYGKNWKKMRGIDDSKSKRIKGILVKDGQYFFNIYDELFGKLKDNTAYHFRGKLQFQFNDNTTQEEITFEHFGKPKTMEKKLKKTINNLGPKPEIKK